MNRFTKRTILQKVIKYSASEGIDYKSGLPEQSHRRAIFDAQIYSNQPKKPDDDDVLD